MAFSKIDGFDVSPRSELSATSRASSPPSTSERLSRSSHGLVPASASERRLGFTSVASVVLIGVDLRGCRFASHLSE